MLVRASTVFVAEVRAVGAQALVSAHVSNSENLTGQCHNTPSKLRLHEATFERHVNTLARSPSGRYALLRRQTQRFALSNFSLGKELQMAARK